MSPLTVQHLIYSPNIYTQNVCFRQIEGVNNARDLKEMGIINGSAFLYQKAKSEQKRLCEKEYGRERQGKQSVVNSARFLGEPHKNSEYKDFFLVFGHQCSTFLRVNCSKMEYI